MKRTKGLALIVIDYLQLMRPAAGTRPESRVLEIGQLTQGLKAIAKELDVPVLALSQLSRAVESREDKRPQLADLRESGTIEQDADVVMFIYRDEYYLEQRMPKIAAFENEEKFQAAHDEWQRQMDRVHNQADLIIAKQRHGPTGTIQLFFEAEFTRFADLDLDAFGSWRRLTSAGAVLEVDLGAIVANWRLLVHAASIRSRRRRGQGGRLRAWRARMLHRRCTPPAAGTSSSPCWTRRWRSARWCRMRWSPCWAARSPAAKRDYLAHDIVPVLGSLGEVDAWRQRAHVSAARCRRSCTSIPACRGSASMRANWRCCNRTTHGWTGSRCAM